MQCNKKKKHVGTFLQRKTKCFQPVVKSDKFTFNLMLQK